MKFFNYLKEEYVGVFRSWQVDVNIFCNPDKKEMAELVTSEYGDVRFIIDFKKKKVFLWTGTIHREAYNYLVKTHEIVNMGKDIDATRATDRYYFGLGHIKGNKIKYSYSDVVSRRTKDEIERLAWLNTDFSWLLDYFYDTDFLTVKHLISELA